MARDVQLSTYSARVCAIPLRVARSEEQPHTFFCLCILSFCTLKNARMRRRDFLKAAVLMPAVATADVPAHLWQGYDFSTGPPVHQRLNQGPFGDRSRRRLANDSVYVSIREATAQSRVRAGWLCLGRKWPFAGREGWPGDAGATRRENVQPAVCGRSVHPLRLAECANTARSAGSKPSFSSGDGCGQA